MPRQTSNGEDLGVGAEYNLIWCVEHCLNDALQLATHVADARRADEQAEIFRRAHSGEDDLARPGTARRRTRSAA